MRFEETVDINAPAAALWAVLMDLDAWPRMTESVTSVKRLTPAPLEVGSKVEITQPRLGRAEWVVTEMVEGDHFTWVNRRPGVTTTAVHALEPGFAAPGAALMLHLIVEQSGALAWPLGGVAGGLTRRYLAMEAAGCKRLAEESHAR